MAGFSLSAYERSLIVQQVTGCSATALIAGTAPPPTPTQQAEIDRLIRERTENRVPLQYLLGEAWFYGRRFEVNPAVLIPRPETELLCEAVLSWIKVQPPKARWQLVDVGTGSGCIAITLVLELAKLGVAAQVWATDISAEALVVAQENAMVLGAAVGFKLGDLLAGESMEGSWDVIVSNPPYIDPALSPTLEPEVYEHEPHTALFASNEGFELLHRLGEQARLTLRPGGLLAVEVGQAMAPPLAEYWKTVEEFRSVAIRRDYAGLERMVLAQQPPQ